MRMNIYMSLHCHITDGQWTFKHISAQEIIGLLLLCNKSFTEHIFNKNLDFFFKKGPCIELSIYESIIFCNYGKGSLRENGYK